MLEKGFTVPALLHPALPPSVSWFPLPPGWLVLGALLLAALAIYLFFRLARWRRNRWRREALAAFALPHSVDGWMALIKQIQLVHQPRNVVSHSLTPESLLDQLPLEADLQQTLCLKYCQRDNRLESEQASRLRQQLTRWLKELPDV
ncbi:MULTISPECIES: DUF4381 family protein [Enterobacteriaceae]|uniref:DUF4381 family protein n=1 Tax=Raoultella lignicola TaxID=3040939 RepID=A0ABU9F549_9ENTR|nr:MULTISPECIES: DUF4381 family protein [Enterobacteriaceae]MRT51695.1 DUF4381 family protein [Raoultella sp. RIT712]QNK07851.1 DUF4381 family protein [Enterobacter sp. JUb54]